MSEYFDLHHQYPDLFEMLTEEQRRNVMHSFASSWLEGDNPTRDDAALLIDYALGRITAEEYDRKALEQVLAYRTLTDRGLSPQGAEAGEQL